MLLSKEVAAILLDENSIIKEEVGTGTKDVKFPNMPLRIATKA